MKKSTGWTNHAGLAASMLLLGNGALVQLAFVHDQLWYYLLLITTPLLVLLAIKTRKHIKNNKYEKAKFRTDIEGR